MEVEAIITEAADPIENPVIPPDVETPEEPSEPTSIFSDEGNFTFRDGWANSLEGDEFNETRATLANYKDLGSLSKALVDNKRAATARTDGMVKLPTGESTPEEISAYREAIGMPSSIEEYQITPPETMPEGVDFNAENLEGFKKFAFENNFTPEQANKLIEFQAQMESADLSAYNVELEQGQAAANKQLQDEWGPQWQQNNTMASRVAKTFGLDPEHAAMQNPDVKRAMLQASKLMSEDKFVSGDSITGRLSPGNEAADIMSNPDNALHVAYHDTSHPGHDAAVNTYLRKLEEQTQIEGH